MKKVILPFEYKNIVYREGNDFEVYRFDRTSFYVDFDGKRKEKL